MKKKEILFTAHARKRMSARNITTDQILECIERGKLSFSNTSGHYLYTYKEIQAVLETSKESKFAMDVVTVMYISSITNKIRDIAKYYETDEETAVLIYKQAI
jgi:hypothetical protein